MNVTKLPTGASTRVKSLSEGPDRRLWALTYDDALLVSADGAHTWSSRAAPPTRATEAVHAAEDGSLWLCADGVAHESRDDGVSWITHARPAFRGLTEVFAARGAVLLSGARLLRRASGKATWPAVKDVVGAVARIQRAADGKLFATANSAGTAAVVCSDDDGASWRTLLSAGGKRATALSVTGGTLYVALYDLASLGSPTSCGLRSRDQGATWEEMPLGVHPQQELRRLCARGERVYGFAFETYVRSESRLVLPVITRSLDGGARWEALPLKSDTFAWAMTLTAAGELLVSAEEGCLWRVDD
jgi:hypothetical protein